MQDYSEHLLQAQAVLKAMSDAASKRQYAEASGLAIDLGMIAVDLTRAFRELDNAKQ